MGVGANGDGYGCRGLEEASETFRGFAFERTRIENAKRRVAQRLCGHVERRRLEDRMCTLELVQGEELADAQRAHTTGFRVELDADDAATEEDGREVIGDDVTFDANDRGERPARAIDEAARAVRRSIGERTLEARGIEIALRENERARAIRRDDELLELTRIDAAVTRSKRLKLRLGDDLRDEREELGVCEQISRADVEERVEAGGGRDGDERREIDRMIDGPGGRGRTARDEQREDREDQRTTLTQAKRRFFEPTRRKYFLPTSSWSWGSRVAAWSISTPPCSTRRLPSPFDFTRPTVASAFASGEGRAGVDFHFVRGDVVGDGVFE